VNIVPSKKFRLIILFEEQKCESTKYNFIVEILYLVSIIGNTAIVESIL
jgi:hypothetical protein